MLAGIFLFLIQRCESNIELHNETRLNAGTLHIGANEGLGVFQCALNPISAFSAVQYLCDDEVTEELRLEIIGSRRRRQKLLLNLQRLLLLALLRQENLF